MFRTPTVFILGAGAGFDSGFPLGTDLRAKIRVLAEVASGLRRDRIEDQRARTALQSAVRESGNVEAGDMLAAFREIASFVEDWDSIDDFMHSRSHDAALQFAGKALIGHAIIEAEANSKLIPDAPHLDSAIKAIRGSFYHQLFQALSKGWNVKDYESCLNAGLNNLTIITFNYDRAFEWSFAKLAERTFGIDSRQAQLACNGLEVIHVYGKAGDLPHETQEESAQQPFGEVWALGPNNGPQRPSTLPSIVKRLRTYTEAVDDVTRGRARSAIFQANNVFVVGCAPHAQNMEFLFGGDGPAFGVPCTVCMTAVKMSEYNQSAVQDYITEKGARAVHVNSAWGALNIIPETITAAQLER